MKKKILLIFSILLFSSYLSADTIDLESYLIAHYKLNDDLATSVVLDDTGDHNGNYKDTGGNINTNTGSTAGRVSLALDFDGGDEYVEIADHADFTPAGTAFSISTWINAHDLTNFEIASKGVYNTDAEWRVFTGADDEIYAYFYDESVANCYIGRNYNSALTAYENQWIHVVMTSDGGTASSGIKIYINNVQVDDTTSESNAGSFVAAENLSHAVWIGRYSTTYADGLIDNVMFFNKELDSDDVTFLYNGGLGREDFTHYVIITN